MRWLLLLPLVAAVEIALMVAAGYAIGVWPTLGLLALAAVVGVFLARAEGLRVWRSYQEALAEQRMPEEGILSGLLVLLGGALLLMPGFLSDLAGIALMIPWTRRVVADRVRAYLTAKMSSIRVVNLATDLPDFAQAQPDPWESTKDTRKNRAQAGSPLRYTPGIQRLCRLRVCTWLELARYHFNQDQSQELCKNPTYKPISH